MAEQPDSGNPGPQDSFVLHRRELPPTRRERMLRIGLRVVTVVLLAAALIDLVMQLAGHGR
ncbi:hypothetical protein KOEU_34980 [Komagataeibacter europaeus]|uniref:Uncharacterized protein n=2 Tax=Komagataeibacter europaeus TaxID=33995 RepID=A0A0D6PZY6_KOMEU|nr:MULTISPECIES: hypothetical protein [Komagataeibacter]ARW17692.1 hypothetical protein S101446_02598 [Komagataeibacter europaeus]KON63016.1 hypothetical protein KOEU_34980 [Komagataeibacter europaeus]MBE7730652.1 hypothetical protein [Komagataeibacter sp. FXV3]GAN96724.1 hypothetical protein Geu3261_0093_007 [Komagataeibacter europaeus NBRC 3261]